MGLSFYEKKKKSKKLWTLLLVLVIAALGAACWMFKVKQEERELAARKKTGRADGQDHDTGGLYGRTCGEEI